MHRLGRLPRVLPPGRNLILPPFRLPAAPVKPGAWHGGSNGDRPLVWESVLRPAWAYGRFLPTDPRKARGGQGRPWNQQRTTVMRGVHPVCPARPVSPARRHFGAKVPLRARTGTLALIVSARMGNGS